MPEADVREEKNFYLDIPQTNEAFFLKGYNNLDWGLKNRLSQILDWARCALERTQPPAR